MTSRLLSTDLLRRPALWASVGALAGLAGCLDLGLTSSIVFPPDIPGLEMDQPWVRLPVGAWVTEGRVEPVAIAGCFAPSCSPQSAVGLFRARGDEAERLSRIADHPERLARAVLEGKRRPAARGLHKPRVAVSAEPVRDGAWRGFSLDMARADGSGGAHAAVLTRMTPGALTIVLVVSSGKDAALRIARDVAAGQG